VLDLVSSPLKTDGPANSVVVENWGVIDYRDAEDRQLRFVDEIAQGLRPETVVVCSHPPVVTKGRATQGEDIFGWAGPVYEVSRGGRATYHGPEQIVIYPMINLSQRGKDIRAHLRKLEVSVLVALKNLGIEGELREAETGVWVADRKVCSFGVACRHWVTYHGLALYVEPSTSAYSGIHPCGYKTSTMISVEELLGKRTDRTQMAQMICDQIISSYQC
jgi:lipoate-protein ligase B